MFDCRKGVTAHRNQVQSLTKKKNPGKWTNKNSACKLLHIIFISVLCPPILFMSLEDRWHSDTESGLQTSPFPFAKHANQRKILVQKIEKKILNSLVNVHRKKKYMKSCVDNYSHTCIYLQEMTKIKKNQNKHALYSGCCALFLIVGWMIVYLIHEPTLNSNLRTPPDSHHLYFVRGWGECPLRKEMGWEGVGKNNTVFDPLSTPLALVNSLSGCWTRLWDQGKKSKQNKRVGIPA